MSSDGRPSGSGSTTTTTASVATRQVKEYHWKVSVSYRWSAFQGTGSSMEDGVLMLEKRTIEETVISASNKKPFPHETSPREFDLNLTWLLQQLKEENCCFSIDRSVETCRTPRRNNDITQAMQFFGKLSEWCQSCRVYFCDRVYGSLFLGIENGDDTRSKLESIAYCDNHGVFAPVLPLMETNKKDRERSNKRQKELSRDSSEARIISRLEEKAHVESSPLLSLHDITLFLQEQQRSLAEAFQCQRKEFQNSEDAFAVSKMVLVWAHLEHLVEQWRDGIQYVEQMLRNQLIAAIGKEVRPHDLDQFVKMQNQRILGKGWCKPFCYHIRQPDHFPDGLLSIESSTVEGGSNNNKPIETIVRRIPGQATMSIPLNAATKALFLGHQFLHAWVRHRFANSHQQYSIVARARQFSSFILLVGNISGPDQFNAKDAILLQNKDEIVIPLLLEDLPTAKNFRDAISSLSPEQQRFAQSIRRLQLESSVFGVCVIPLKPQLEVLLGLPRGTLTKEIALTQDLLSLFIEYQVPSDLLRLDNSASRCLETSAAVSAVKGHVQAVMDVIAASKQTQLASQQQVASATFQKHRLAGSVSRKRRCKRKAAAWGGRDSSTMNRPPHLLARKQFRRATPYCSAESDAKPATTSLGKNAARNDDGTRADDDFDVISIGSNNGDEGKSKTNKHGQESKEQDGWEMMTPIDFSSIPRKLDRLFEREDSDNALKTTIIKTGPDWKRKRQENLLSKMEEFDLSTQDQRNEKNKVFDLLDALSRSGSLPIACGELHVLVGVAHSFEDSVMDTVIKRNVNPLEKMEKSTMLIAQSVHNVTSPEGLETDFSKSLAL